MLAEDGELDQSALGAVTSIDRSTVTPLMNRLEDRGLEELAASLDEHGQQQPIIARLITPTDRRRWPEKFRPDQIILILHGHRIHAAQRIAELHQVHLAQIGHQRAQHTVGGGVLGVALHDVETTAEEAQVPRHATERSAQLGIVALALDAGHLFLVNLQIQNAVDSATPPR